MLHSLTGYLNLALITITFVTGLILYKYVTYQASIPFSRQIAAKAHLICASFFLVSLFFHYQTAKKIHFLLSTGAVLLLIAFLSGLSLRLSRNYYRAVIRFKIALFIISAFVLASGHFIVHADHHHDKVSVKEILLF